MGDRLTADGALARHAAADAGQERASGRSISAQHRSAGPGALTAPAFSLGSDRRAVAHSSINALFFIIPSEARTRLILISVQGGCGPARRSVLCVHIFAHRFKSLYDIDVVFSSLHIKILCSNLANLK